MFYLWHPSCWSRASDKPYTGKGPVSAYDKRNISVFICDTDIRNVYCVPFLSNRSIAVTQMSCLAIYSGDTPVNSFLLSNIELSEQQADDFYFFLSQFQKYCWAFKSSYVLFFFLFMENRKGWLLDILCTASLFGQSFMK